MPDTPSPAIPFKVAYMDRKHKIAQNTVKLKVRKTTSQDPARILPISNGEGDESFAFWDINFKLVIQKRKTQKEPLTLPLPA